MTSSRDAVTALIEDVISDTALTNPEAVGARFAEDAVYLVGPGFELVKGRAAIVAELVRQTTTFADLSIDVTAWVADEARAVTERTDTFTLRHNNVVVQNPVVAVFDVNADGLITGWREYWDMGTVAKAIALPRA